MDAYRGILHCKARSEAELRGGEKNAAFCKANYGISQADMYQMYAYQKKYGAQNVTLLYPRTENLQTENIIYRSDDLVTVHVQFIDLFEPASCIARLSQIQDGGCSTQ